MVISPPGTEGQGKGLAQHNCPNPAPSLGPLPMQLAPAHATCRVGSLESVLAVQAYELEAKVKQLDAELARLNSELEQVRAGGDSLGRRVGRGGGRSIFIHRDAHMCTPRLAKFAISSRSRRLCKIEALRSTSTLIT